MSTYEPASSDDLLSRLSSADEPLRNEIFADLRARFVELTKRRIGAEDAEDVAQEACVTVFEKYRNLPAETNLAAWSYQVLRNKIGNRLQQRARSAAQSGIAVDSLPSQISDSRLEVRLLACLRKIVRVNSRYARVLNLSQLGFSTSDICERLGTSKDNLYVLLNRSRAQLRRCLKEGDLND